MSLRILIDMNLSPNWVNVLQRHGWSAVHWCTVGDPCATDQVVMRWALDHQYVVFTHDLDFGTVLALTHAKGPSVIQLRTDDVLSAAAERWVVAAINQHRSDLLSGALVVIECSTARVRILPL